MVSNLKLILALGWFVIVFFEKSSTKQVGLEERNTEIKDFMNLFDDKENTLNNDRHARHVQAVTETVFQHIMEEFRKEYVSKNYSANSPLRKMLRALNEKFQNSNQKRMLKQKEQNKKSHHQKKKHSKRRRKTTKPPNKN